MSDTTELIRLVNNRYELNEEDLKRYFNIIDLLIKQTAESLRVRYSSSGLMNVDSIITEDDFLNMCWDMVEGSDDNTHGLVDRLKDSSFPDDNRLKSYLKKTFENLLRDTLNRKNPEFNTRKKQFDRVLKPLCVKRKWQNSQLWQLKGCDSSPVNPPDSDALKGYSSQIAMPEIRYRRSEDAQRGPAIKDSDMREYLLKIFDRAGGSIYEKDLDELLNYIFGFHSVSFINDHSGSELEKSRLEQIQSTKDESCEPVMSCSCYRAIAESCFNTMADALRQMIYYLYVRDMDQGEAAKKMGRSGTAISNMKDALKVHMKSCIEKDPSEISYEEGEIIFELIKELIINDRRLLS